MNRSDALALLGALLIALVVGNLLSLALSLADELDATRWENTVLRAFLARDASRAQKSPAD